MINISTNDKNNTRTKPEESENDTRKILLINVDDEMGILKMNKRIVKKLGYDHECCLNSTEFIELLNLISTYDKK